jgi:hypothetical protein
MPSPRFFTALSSSLDFALRPPVPVVDLLFISGLSFFMLLTDRLLPYTLSTSFLTIYGLSSASGFLNVIARSVIALHVFPFVFLICPFNQQLSFFSCQPSDNALFAPA